MNETIAQFRCITDDYVISDEEIKKFVNWGKGDIQQALNYYYRKKEKQSKSTLQSAPPVKEESQGAFTEMWKASLRQKKTEAFIHQVRDEYKLPIVGRKNLRSSNNIKRESQPEELMQDEDAEFADADYIPEIFKMKDEEGQEMFGRMKERSEEEQVQQNLQQEEVQKEEYKNEPEAEKIDFGPSKQEEEEQELKEVLPKFEIIMDQSQIYLGEVIVFGFAIKFVNNVDLPDETPVEYRYYIQQEKIKKGIKNSKKTDRNMSLRLILNSSEFGRLKDEEVRILLPLIMHKMVRIELFAFDVPRRVDVYTNIKLKARIYLLRKAITQPVVQTYEGQSDLVVSIYKPVCEEVLALFDRLQLPIKTWPLIKKKSKIKHNRDGINQFKRAEQLHSLKEQEQSKRQSDQQTRMRNDPFLRTVQKNISDMIKFSAIPVKEDSNTTNTVSLPAELRSKVKKRVLELKTIEDDKCAQLVDLYEEDLEPYHPKSNFKSHLYNYQALALSWMLRREGHHLQHSPEKEELHPLWTEYELEGKYRLFMNELTSQISIKPPMSKSKCLGGILADQMGLGKTVMMAALITTNPRRKGGKKQGGNLVVVPLTLLSQWDQQIKRHTSNVKTLIYYSEQRKKSVNELQNYDVVITTYGTVSHEYSKGFHVSRNGIFRLKWGRVILDEAHYIKGRIIQTAKAVYEIDAVFRWCLTGTPIQNNLTDMFSLLHFIKYTPWSEYECWNKYINKPQEVGDENVYEVLRTILKRVFLRRTKQSKDSNGKNIVELPAKVSTIQLLQMSEKERQFYDGVFERSKLKIEELDRLGILQTKYMQILELLMRLRQICCHSLLFKSIPNFIKNAEQFEGQLRKFVKKRELANQSGEEDGFKQNYFQPVMEGDVESRVEVVQSRNISENYIKEVMKKIDGKQLQNCLVCLNEVEDPVITSCLHIFCKTCAIRQIQECGICSACRKRITKQDFLHLPRDNRFNINYDQGNYFPSTKITALVEHLRKLKPLDKVVVFSQFLGMLDLIEHELKSEKITYVRMEGSTAHKERTRIVEAFQKDPSIQIFIVSLKTAGVGLNLVAANKVFLMDPWWNPGVEEQAIQRVHRIGQKRDVQVVRFIMDKSIEMRMVELNTSKKQLSHKVLSTQGVPQGGESRVEKLKYLMEKY